MGAWHKLDMTLSLFKFTAAHKCKMFPGGEEIVANFEGQKSEAINSLFTFTTGRLKKIHIAIL